MFTQKFTQGDEKDILCVTVICSAERRRAEGRNFQMQDVREKRRGTEREREKGK